MVVLHAPKASSRKGLTASQWLYREYVTAKRQRNRQRMEAAREGLVRICIHACGNIRPFWSPTPPTGVELLHPFATFRLDGIKDRRHFAAEFLKDELERRMTATEAQHVARRCKLRLIDKIRSDTRRERGIGRKSNEQYRAALEKVKHLQPSWKWKGDDPIRLLWQHIKGNCGEWRAQPTCQLQGTGIVPKVGFGSCGSDWLCGFGPPRRMTSSGTHFVSFG